MNGELDETEALAAEYVLGLLDRAARAEVKQRLRADPALARAVDLWQQRLAPLDAAILPVEPPPAAWLGIAQALVGQGQPAAPEVRRVRVRHHGLRYSVTFWRWCTIGTGALAAVLALYIAGAPLRPPPPADERYVAVLGSGEAGPALIATLDPATGRVTIRPLALAAPEDRALELWLIAGENQPPRSLGLLDPEQTTALELTPGLEAAARPSAALAVSLEPQGGSPTGQPTGPVLYHGPLLALAE